MLLLLLLLTGGGMLSAGHLLGLVLLGRGTLGLEGSHVGLDHHIELSLELGTVTKVEHDLIDDKVRRQDHSLQQVVHELGCTLLIDTVADKLGNPGNNVNIECNLVGVGVGLVKVGGVFGESEEQGGGQELFIEKTEKEVKNTKTNYPSWHHNLGARQTDRQSVGRALTPATLSSLI